MLIYGAETQHIFGRTIRTKLVGHHDRWSDTRLLQEFAYQPRCSPGLAATLYQEIRHLTFAVDGTPKTRFLTSGHDDHFIGEPVIGWLVTVLSKTLSVNAIEMQKPPTHGLIGDIEPAFCKKFFRTAKAEGEASPHPDRQLNDLWWIATTAIQKIFHAVVRVNRHAIREQSPLDDLALCIEVTEEILGRQTTFVACVHRLKASSFDKTRQCTGRHRERSLTELRHPIHRLKARTMIKPR